MSLQDTHIIQKSHLKIKLRDQGSAYDIQSRVIDVFQSQGLQALEEEMDRLAPAGEVISLDSLQLDLGHIALDDLEESLPRLLAARLREVFTQAIADAGQEPKTAVKQAHLLAADLALLLRFLDQGTTGWEVAVGSFDASALLAKILDSQADALIDALRPLLQQRHVRERLSLQFAQVELLRLLHHLQPQLDRLVSPLQERLEALSALLSVFPQSAARRRTMVLNFLLAQPSTVAGGASTLASDAQVDEAWRVMLNFWLREEWISADRIAYNMADIGLQGLLGILSKIDDQERWARVLQQQTALKSIGDTSIGKFLIPVLQAGILATFEHPQAASVHAQIEQHILAIMPLLTPGSLATVVEAFELDIEALAALSSRQAWEEQLQHTEIANRFHSAKESQVTLEAESDPEQKENATELPIAKVGDHPLDAPAENVVDTSPNAGDLDHEDLKAPKVAEEKITALPQVPLEEIGKLRADAPLDDIIRKEKGADFTGENDTPTTEKLDAASEKSDHPTEKSDDEEAAQALDQIARENIRNLATPEEAQALAQIDQQNQQIAQTLGLNPNEIKRLQEKFSAFQAKIDAENRAALAIDRPSGDPVLDQGAVEARLKTQAETPSSAKGIRNQSTDATAHDDDRIEYDGNKNPWIPKSRRAPHRNANDEAIAEFEARSFVKNADDAGKRPYNAFRHQAARRYIGPKPSHIADQNVVGKVTIALGQETALSRKKSDSIRRLSTRCAADVIALEQRRQARIAAEVAAADEYAKAEKAKSQAAAAQRATELGDQDRVRALSPQPRMQASYPHDKVWGSDHIHYVNNAGLILLNPFFQPCFQDLGWLENGEFVDEEAQENAVLLMAWIACGDLEISEACLPLAKVLCGMDVGRPVRIEVDLPPRALEEGLAMMEAAASYWEKAGKLSPDQLRGAFLMRDGRLQDILSGWNLKVDRQTIDILLEFLPWGYGTIMLPWTRKLLTVDW